MKITVTRMLVASAAMMFLATNVVAQTETKNFTVSGGTGLTGTLGGSINATVKSQTTDGTVQTAGALFITDLDIVVDGGGLVPNGNVQNATASSTINIANTSLGINIPTANLSSPLSGSFSITAGDNLADAVPGSLDAGMPGSDGAWDDPGQTGIFNNAFVNSSTLTANNPLSVPANVTGGFNFQLGNDILIQNVINTALLDVDLRLKQSSTIGVVFDNAQNIALQSLSFTTTAPSPEATFATSNFVEASHPVGVPQLDLSVIGGGLVETTISGSLAADLTGTVVGNIDMAIDLQLIGFISTTIDMNNVLNGNLSDPGISLVDLSEAISLPGVELPFSFTILHEPTVDPDFDDIIAMIQTGTLGLTIPFDVNEELVVPLPDLDFAIENQTFDFEQGCVFGVCVASADVSIDMAASIGGNIVLDLDASLELNLDAVVSAFAAGAVNVVAVPEPTSGLFLASLVAGAGAVVRRRRK